MPQSEQQRQKAYTDAGLSYTPAPINSTTINPSSSLQYQTANETPIFPVAGLDANAPTAPLTATQPEQQANDISAQIQQLNDRIVGQSDFRAQEEAKQGIPALNQTQTDLTSRLKALQNEALAIPLQLQQNTQGRGVTAGGLQPHQTAALRNNAIQALSTSSLLEASRGNLVTAQEMVDRAVAQRFDPIKEEIAAKTANLDLILKSPAYSLADKNRAQAQKDAQDIKTRLIAKQEQNATTAQTLAAAALRLNPNDPHVALAANQVLKLDPNDPQYLEKAFALVGQFQQDPTAVQEALVNLKLQQEELANAPLNRQIKQAQLAGQNLSNSKTKAEINAINSPSSLRTSDGKPLNATQASALGYAQRVSTASQIIDGLASQASDTSNLGSAFGKWTPNALKSADQQKIDQATNNFVTAVLRKESGAAISESEYATAKATYIPQYGDSAAVLAQKAQARSQAYQNLITEAGSPNVPATSTANDQYAQYRTQVPSGQILIQRNGQIGAIPQSEFNAKTDKKL